MRVRDITDDAGRLLAFEVDGDFLFGRPRIAAIAASIPGARMGPRPRLFGGPPSWEFQIGPTRFVIGDEWGGGYRIEPSPRVYSETTALVRDAFARHPGVWRSPGPLVRPALVAVLVVGAVVQRSGSERGTYAGLVLLSIGGLLAAYDSVGGRRAARKEAARLRSGEDRR
jgi:hypothetical protein